MQKISKKHSTDYLPGDHKYRIEKKFILPTIVTDQGLIYFHLKELGFREQYSRRFVHSLYMDTYNYELLNSAIEGNRSRYKIRFRWYSENQKILWDQHTSGSLEIKIRYNDLGTKVSLPFELPKGLRFDASYGLPKLAIQRVRLESDLGLGSMVRDLQLLSLYSGYMRRYFVDVYTKIRVTVDEQIFLSPDLNRIRFGASALMCQNFSILEVKFAHADIELAQSYFERFEFRSSKVSKYILGLRPYEAFTV